MRKTLLLIASLFAISMFGETSVAFDWAKTATLGSSKQTTAQQPLALSNGNVISVFTTTGSSDFKINGESIDLKDEGTTISPSNIVFSNISADGTMNWIFNSVRGGVSFNAGSLAEIPGKDLAVAAFSVRYNKVADTAEELVKFIDAKGIPFSIKMECPSAYNPYEGVLLTFKPSTGEIVSLSKIESEHSVAGKNIAQTLYINGVAATEKGFYITGYAYSDVTFPGNVKFTPSKGVPSDWNGSTAIGNGFTALFSVDGTCSKVVESNVTSDVREGNYLIRSTDNQIFVIGMSNSSLLYFNYDSELKLLNSSVLPFSDASNGSHNALLKKLDVTPGCAYVSGHLAGGFEGTDIKTSGTSGNQFGFVIKIDRSTATITGGGVEDAMISGYYGAYENEADNTLYAIGYNMNQKIAFVQPYTSDWEKKDRITLFTTTGTPALWPTEFNGVNNSLLLPGRSNQKAVLGDVTIAEGFTAFSGFLAKYSFNDFKLADVSETIADAITSPISVRGTVGQVIVSSSVPATVNIYNISGSLVRSVNVNAGETAIDLNAGFYIAAGSKVIVR